MVKRKKHHKISPMNIKKRVEPRKMRLIQGKVPHCYIIFDLGAGSGVYIPYLLKKAKHVVALDIDKKNSIEVAQKGYEVVLADAKNIPFRNEAFDVLWASEIVEHFESLKPLDELERVTGKIIIITMPNPLSPHFKRDATHLLKYSVISLEKYFKKRSKKTLTKYVIRGLGFDEIPIPRSLKLFTMLATWFIPVLAPTITVIGIKNIKNLHKLRLLDKQSYAKRYR
jgi:ubiquinone/menaquinone biosynthesis C-methylase UbiE